jgi:4'-phosphopantetheinyl transferase
VAAGREVGIDLEIVRTDLDYPEMALHCMSDRERSELFVLPPEERLAAFYRLWTRKEAYLKGSGTGFSRPCSDFDVSLIPGHPELLCHRTSPEETSRWTLMDIPVPEGYCAALAFEGEKPDVTIFPAGKP